MDPVLTPRVAVIGAGGVGGYFAARLADAGRDVSVIARGRHLEAIQSGGMRVESVAGDVVARVHATDDPSAVGRVDVVLVAVKTWQVGEAAVICRTLLGDGTSIVALQNGIEAADRIAAVVGHDAVLGGVTRIISYIAEPGLIRHVGGPGAIEFGELDGGTTDRLEKIRAILDVPGTRVTVSPDIRVALWEKLMFVVPFGAVGAVSRAPIGITRTLPGTRRLIDDAMREIETVARALGMSLPDDVTERAWSFLDGLPPAGTASLQRDIAGGRPSELEDWCGTVVRTGERAGVPVPVLTFIYHSLLPLESRARGELTFVD
jgi:2-dehydropantoate 2-reductase